MAHAQQPRATAVFTPRAYCGAAAAGVTAAAARCSAAAASAAPAAPWNVTAGVAAAPRDLLHSDLSTCEATAGRCSANERPLLALAEPRPGIPRSKRKRSQLAPTRLRHRRRHHVQPRQVQQHVKHLRSRRRGLSRPRAGPAPAPPATVGKRPPVLSSRTSSRSSRPPRRVSSSSSARTARRRSVSASGRAPRSGRARGSKRKTRPAHAPHARLAPRMQHVRPARIACATRLARASARSPTSGSAPGSGLSLQRLYRPAAAGARDHRRRSGGLERRGARASAVRFLLIVVQVTQVCKERRIEGKRSRQC